MYINDKYVLCDIDGTIAKMSDRGPFEFNKVHTDSPITPIIEIVKYFYQQDDCTVIFLSGRDSSCYTKTYQWLHYHFLGSNISKKQVSTDNSFILLMRENKDRRCDTIVKKEIYEQRIKPFTQSDPYLVFDDRPKVVNLWNDLGFKTLACADQRVIF